MACTVRLNQHDLDRLEAQMKAQARLIAAEVSKMFGDGNSGDDDEDDLGADDVGVERW